MNEGIKFCISFLHSRESRAYILLKVVTYSQLMGLTPAKLAAGVARPLRRGSR